jgi:hypothetical protein
VRTTEKKFQHTALAMCKLTPPSRKRGDPIKDALRWLLYWAASGDIICLFSQRAIHTRSVAHVMSFTKREVAGAVKTRVYYVCILRVRARARISLNVVNGRVSSKVNEYER